jgi:hypothetical protein
MSLGDAWYILAHIGTGWKNFFNVHFWISGAIANQNFSQAGSVIAEARLLLVPLSAIFMVFGEYIEHRAHINTWLAAHSIWLRWTAYYALILWILVFGYFSGRTFIYFQF